MDQRDDASKPSIDGYRHGRVPREIREQQLLDVAEGVFAEFGYNAASIEEITRRASVKRPLIYTYFGGKEGLYLACHERARRELEERLRAAIGDANPDAGPEPDLRAILQRVCRGYFEFLAEHPARWELLLPSSALDGAAAERIRAVHAQTVDVYAAAIRSRALKGVDSRTAEAFAHAASGAGTQLARWWRENPELELDELVDWQTRFTWAGLSQLVCP
jgi:AcrR family transcriptional regulator